MTPEQIVQAILYGRPGEEFVYQGDGSSLDPYTAENGDACAGLLWFGNQPAPTMDDITGWLAEAEATAQIATAEDHASASRSILTAQLAAVPVQKTEIATILGGLLGQAKSAIPFFEQYALDPSMTAQQWTDFQALDQSTKDRLLYDAVRSLAALMRYLTGDLPTS